MKFTALLPLKKNSERVKNKNIKNFCERPLYQVICKTLEDCKNISEILINTDSEYIAEEAPKFFSKVKIINRPQELCGDKISMNKIISYDLKISCNENIIQTHSTNPLLSLSTLNKALKFYSQNLSNYDSLFSANKIQNRFYDKNLNPLNHNPNELIRTQDLDPIFEENSNFYIFSKQSFAKKHNRIGEKPFIFEMDKLESIDIDNQDDFTLAEFIYKNTKQKLNDRI